VETPEGNPRIPAFTASSFSKEDPLADFTPFAIRFDDATGQPASAALRRPRLPCHVEQKLTACRLV
jgi:hypothetical protein